MSSLPVVFMFSGQGSQYFQMAATLYREQSRFRQLLDHCDRLIRPRLGCSLLDIIHGDQGKDVAFDRVFHTNPALLSVQYCQARLLMELGLKPDYLLGYSLGEFIAAVVAEAISLEDGLNLVMDYAEQLERTPATEGTMMAVLAEPELMQQHVNAFQGCWLAGRNFSGNFVVSGKREDIERLRRYLDDKQILNQVLPVRNAFHTQLMEAAEPAFYDVSERAALSQPRIPMISAYLRGPVDELSVDHFWELTRYSVEFSDTVAYLLQQGDYHFIDAGPSGTLATFVKYLLPGGSRSTTHATLTPFGRDLQYLDQFRQQGLIG